MWQQARNRASSQAWQAQQAASKGNVTEKRRGKGARTQPTPTIGVESCLFSRLLEKKTLLQE